MDYEKFKQVYEEVLKDPDKAVSTGEEFLSEMKEVFDTSIAYTERIKELEEKNNDLRDANIKLLLRETSQSTNEEHQQEKTSEEILKEFEAKLLNK